jgi:type I restriction enzyme R subunit
MKFNENATVENYVIKFMQKELGYTYMSRDEFTKLRESENDYLVPSLLSEAIKNVNEVHDETIVANVIREVRKADTNQGFLELLRNGVELKDQSTGKTAKYRLIDFVPSSDKNSFVITNQFYFAGDTENIRTDVTVFVNGIPLADIEAKSPTASQTTDYTEAIGQLKRYERVAPRFFIPNLFNIATDGLQTVYGATYAPEQYFLKWRDGDLLIKIWRKS